MTSLPHGLYVPLQQSKARGCRNHFQKRHLSGKWFLLQTDIHAFSNTKKIKTKGKKLGERRIYYGLNRIENIQHILSN